MEPGPVLGSGWNWDRVQGSGWSWDPGLGSRQSWDPTLGSAVEMELPAPGMQPEWEQEKRAEHGKKGQPLL